MRRRPLHFLCYCLLLLAALCGSPAGYAEAIKVKDIAVLVDALGLESIASVSQAPAERFVPLSHNLTAGYSRSVHWLRFTLQAPVAGEYWLEMQPPFVDSIRLFEPLASNSGGPVRFAERRYGDHLPFAERETPYRAFVAKLRLPDDAPHTYYLRLKTNSTSMLFLSLWRPADFEQAKSQEYALLGTYFGLMLTLLGINLLYWFWMRDSLHGYFSLFVLVQLGLYLGANGFVAQFLLPDLPAIGDQWVGGFMFLAFSASSLFYQRLLHVERCTRWLYLVFQVQLILPLLLLPALFLDFFPEAMRLLMLSIFIFAPAALWLAYRRWREQDSGSFFALLGITISVLGVMFSGLGMLGIWPSDLWQLHSRQITVMGNILAMHIAVATRFRDLKAQHREAVLLAEQAEIRSAQERREQNEHRQFLAMLTHELRTPLAVIDGAVQSLEYLQQAEDDETRLRHQRIRRSVGRINGLIKQFLAKDRVEDARLSLQGAPLDSLELARQAIAASVENASERIRLAADDNPPVYGDAALLQVALCNLIDNALKYSPREAPVELRVEAHERQGQPGVAWTVSDQGAGISPENWEEIFGKYVRGDGHGHIAGTGLGLYLVRRIAELHGGSVEIIEREAWGGVLRFWLPNEQAAR